MIEPPKRAFCVLQPSWGSLSPSALQHHPGPPSRPPRAVRSEASKLQSTPGGACGLGTREDEEDVSCVWFKQTSDTKMGHQKGL